MLLASFGLQRFGVGPSRDAHAEFADAPSPHQIPGPEDQDQHSLPCEDWGRLV
jgi:hypothetical protein